MDRVQKMALVAADEAMRTAGYDKRPFDRARTAVILGNATLTTEITQSYQMRLHRPLLEAAVKRKLDELDVPHDRAEAVLADLKAELLRGAVPFTEDSFPGSLVSVAAGRVASYLDLHGPSFVVDAACASSLGAIDCAMEGLLAHEFDFAIAGGCHAWLDHRFFVMFSKFRGLSSQRLRPFDAGADGFLLGEGAALFLLKRLADVDAEDEVYAVLRGVGSSSDGREKGIGAPNPKAQTLAMRRALERARTPRTSPTPSSAASYLRPSSTHSASGSRPRR
jgi:acyl transferase domain-containing protein